MSLSQDEIWLRAAAPFAAYRWLQAGVYRATSPVMTPSAAWGLILNLAAIDTRGDVVAGSTQVRADVPKLQIAIGELRRPTKATLYQQLHSYPVGNSGKDLAERTHGAKFWIAPAKRELLHQCDWILGVRGDRETITRVRRGIAGELQSERYGIPFAGDNQHFFDRLEEVPLPLSAHWFAPVLEGATSKRSARLTVGIDRRESHQTTNVLYAPSESATDAPRDDVWTWVPSAP